MKKELFLDAIKLIDSRNLDEFIYKDGDFEFSFKKTQNQKKNYQTTT